jgi:hypothetical protein
MINTYINNEQPNTQINLLNKINNTDSDNDVVITFDAQTLTNESIDFIVKLAEIFDANELGVGNYNFNPFTIEVKRINHYENKLICQ